MRYSILISDEQFLFFLITKLENSDDVIRIRGKSE